MSVGGPPAAPERSASLPAIFVRPIGSPVAIGMAGLVAASLVLSGLELGWIAASQRTSVALVLLGFSFPLQFAAALIALNGRDAAVATAVAILAGSWLCTALVWLSSPPGSKSGALGLLLLAAGGLLAAAAASAATGKAVPAAVFGIEAVRFALAGVHELGGGGSWQDAAGVVGLAVVALGGYAVLALALEDATGSTILPLGRRGRGAGALRDGLEGQARGIEREAGVRNQL